MFGLPNFTRRRNKLDTVTFVPVRKAFKPMIEVKANQSLSGWVNKDKQIKWSMDPGKTYFIDAEKAREFSVKGYVNIINGKVDPVSDDEAAEFRSQITVIGLGGQNG